MVLRTPSSAPRSPGAVTHLTTREDIAPARIGALGICASRGYVPFAAQTDHRIRAVGTVSGIDVRDLLVNDLGRTQGPEFLQTMLDQAGALRTAEARGEAPTTLNCAPESPEGLEEAPTLYREAQDYYRTPRAQHCNSTNEWPLRSIDQMALQSAAMPAAAHATRSSVQARPVALSGNPLAEGLVGRRRHRMQRADTPRHTNGAVLSCGDSGG